MTPTNSHDRLSTLADPACKAFGDSLQPGVTDRLGVRMPLVRRVARDVMRTEDVAPFSTPCSLRAASPPRRR